MEPRQLSRVPPFRKERGKDGAPGKLKIEAVFPEGKVEINQFRKLKKAAGAD